MLDYKTKTKKVWLAWMVGIFLCGFGAVGAESGSICINGQNPEHPYNIDGDVNHNINVLDVVGLLGAIEGRNTTVCGNVNGDLKPDGTAKIDILDLVSLVSYVNAPGYTWVEGAWGECDVDTGLQTQIVECHDKEAQVLGSGVCDTVIGSQVAPTRICEDVAVVITIPAAVEDPVPTLSTLEWDEFMGAQEYEVYIAHVSHPDLPLIHPLPVQTETTYDLIDDGTLHPGEDYLVRIRALDADGNGTAIAGNEHVFQVPSSFTQTSDDARPQSSPFDTQAVILTQPENYVVSQQPVPEGFWNQLTYWSKRLKASMVGDPVEGSFLIVGDEQCLVDRRAAGETHYFDQFIALAGDLENSIITERIYPVTIPRTTVGQLEQEVRNDPCVSGVTDRSTSTDISEGFGIYRATGSASDLQNQDYLNQLGYYSTKTYFESEVEEKLRAQIIAAKNSGDTYAQEHTRVKVAVIDTGVDFSVYDDVADSSLELLKYYPPQGSFGFPDFPGTNPTHPTNVPQDQEGSGTAAVGAIIDPAYGIAGGAVEIWPIKTGSTPLSVYYTLLNAVNNGADIIHIGSAYQYHSCHPAIEHFMQRALTKGVFFVTSSGNGVRVDENGQSIPGRIIPSKDYSPLMYGYNLYPVCSAKRFKGVLGVAAVDNETKELDIYSNFGEPIEVAAYTSGYSKELGGVVKEQRGASIATAQVTGIAALTIGYFKANDWWYDPWLIEDTMLNAFGLNRHNQLDGLVEGRRIADLNQLRIYLEYIKPLSDDARVRGITQVGDNQYVGDGWKGDEHIKVYDRLEVVSDTPELLAGETTQMRATAFLKTGVAQDVTGNMLAWSSEFPDIVSVHFKTGEIQVNPNYVPVNNQPKPVRIIGHYIHNYELLQDEFIIRVLPEARAQSNVQDLELLEIIEGEEGLNAAGVLETGESFRPLQNVGWHDSGIVFKVRATVLDSRGDEVVLDVTNLASVTSSHPDELQLPENTVGVLSTIKSYGGEPYELTVAYDGFSKTFPINVSQENYVHHEVHAPLGTSVHVSQTSEIHHRINLQRDVLPVIFESQWQSLTPGLVFRTENERIIVDGGATPMGTYRIQAQTEYRGLGRNAGPNGGPLILTSQLNITVTDQLEYTQVVATRSPVSPGDRGLAIFRLYHNRETNAHDTITNDPEELRLDDNGNIVVVPPRNDDVIRWSVVPRADGATLEIDRQGIYYTTDDSIATNSFGEPIPTTFEIVAEYTHNGASLRDSTFVTVVPVDNLAVGRDDEIAFMRLTGVPRLFSTETIDPVTRLDIDTREASYKFWAYYANGDVEDKSRISTWSVTNTTDQNAGLNLSQYGAQAIIRVNFCSGPRGPVRVHVVYNDGNKSYEDEVMVDIAYYEPIGLRSKVVKQGQPDHPTPGANYIDPNSEGIYVIDETFRESFPHDVDVIYYIELDTQSNRPTKCSLYYPTITFSNPEIAALVTSFSQGAGTAHGKVDFKQIALAEIDRNAINPNDQVGEIYLGNGETTTVDFEGTYRGQTYESSIDLLFDFEFEEEYSPKVDFNYPFTRYVIPPAEIKADDLDVMEIETHGGRWGLYAKYEVIQSDGRVGHNIRVEHDYDEYEAVITHSGPSQNTTAFLEETERNVGLLTRHFVNDSADIDSITRVDLTHKDLDITKSVEFKNVGIHGYQHSENPTLPTETSLPQRATGSVCSQAGNRADNLIGKGRKDDPFTICSRHQMQNIFDLAEAHIDQIVQDEFGGDHYEASKVYRGIIYFVLGDNISFGVATKPLGFYDRRFGYGVVLDGRNYKVSDFFFTQEDQAAHMFEQFHRVDNLVVENIHLNGGSGASVFSEHLQIADNVHIVGGEIQAGRVIPTNDDLLVDGSAGAFKAYSWDKALDPKHLAEIESNFVPNVDYVGFVRIRNSSVRGTRIKAGNDAGGVIGRVSDFSNFRIENVYVRAEVSSTGGGQYGSAGGIIGSNHYNGGHMSKLTRTPYKLLSNYTYGFDNGIFNTYFTGDIHSRGGPAGGLIGRRNGAPIVKSVVGDTRIVSRGDEAGGMVGTQICYSPVNQISRHNYTCLIADSEVQDTHVWGGSDGVYLDDEDGYGVSNAGGLIGLARGGIVLRSDVVNTVVKGQENVGGMVGNITDYRFRIDDSHSGATVRSSSGYHGGFVGRSVEPTSATMFNGVNHHMSVNYMGNTWDAGLTPGVADIGLYGQDRNNPIDRNINVLGISTVNP